ncbi:MAG: arginine--tRNA ligase [Gemmatimonadetes bacterium]|nr:arginine--tRNA ligase [Gemmatimonadota bacterium]
MKPEPATTLVDELRRAVREVGAPEDFEPGLERPRDTSHGDYATNAALVLSGRLGEPARDVANRILQAFDKEAAGVMEIEVAGPGFLNFRLSDAVYWRGLLRILKADHAYGRSARDRPRAVNVEFVSANPTGPLHVAHGRGAAIGDVVASLFEWTGDAVTREFYVNDAGRQIDLLAASVEARFQQRVGEEAELPEGGYMGEYVRELADRAIQEEGLERLLGMEPEERVVLFGKLAIRWVREGHERDLDDFRVHMDLFREESGLYTRGEIEGVLERLRAGELIYEEGGATWLRTARFGDEKDRVLIKSDGSYTYFLPDIAYHLDKRSRGFDLAVDVWGADHHGHVGRMKAALPALELPEDFLEVVIIQLVTVTRGGKEVRMSKRAGQFVTLRKLFEETGVDVARYFFLMRRAEVPMSFDLDLALDTSEANPVYKIQYAHARLCSVFERASLRPEEARATEEELAELRRESEREIAKSLQRFPDVVLGAAQARAPSQVCAYLERVAGLVNAWYHEGNLDPSLRIIADGPARPGRLVLARAVQITLRNGLRLLGISAPQRMDREE